MSRRGRQAGQTEHDAGPIVQRATVGVPGKRTLTEELGARSRPIDDRPGQIQAQNGEPARAETAGPRNEPTTAPVSTREAEAPGHEGTASAPVEDRSLGGATVNAPTYHWIIPFDRHPMSSPGEQIMFATLFTDPTPNAYKLVYTCLGGDFNAAGSGTKSVTKPGLIASNLGFFIDARWDKRSAVTAKMELQKAADSSVLRTENWTFAARTTAPTTVAQIESGDERPLDPNGTDYSYKAGPDLRGDGRDDYVHQTVLEEFGRNASNLTLADIKPEYARANGLTSDAAVTVHFFGADAGMNGTFTIEAGDHFYDKHGGGMPDKADFEAALVRMKEIYVDLPQTYSAGPGNAIGRFTIRRILKVNGEKKIKKWKT